MKSRALPFLLAIAALLGACGSSYDREEFISELQTDAGITTEQATCVVDTLEEEWGTDRLDDRGDLTAEEETRLGEVAVACLTGG